MFLTSPLIEQAGTPERDDSTIRRRNRCPHTAQAAIPDQSQRRSSGLLHVGDTQLRCSDSTHGTAQCRTLRWIQCPFLGAFGQEA
jgi:hypothetical protein